MAYIAAISQACVLMTPVATNTVLSVCILGGDVRHVQSG